MLRRLSDLCFRHRWATLFVWILALVGLSIAAGAAGGEFSQNGRLPGTDSQRAYDLLQAEMPDDPNIGGDFARLVVHDDRGVDAPAVDARLGDLIERVAALPGVVTAPTTDTMSVSPDGSTASVPFSVARDDTAVVADVQELADAMDGVDGTAVAISGYRFQGGGVPASEGFGLLAAMVILLLAFGSVVAMGLPIVTAVFGIVAGLAGVELWSAFVSTPDFTVQVASMVGIGVGIDYALFIVTRYREATQRGLAPRDALGESIDTAGRAVVFAGTTVVISLLGMLLMRLSFLNGLALGTSTAVLVAVIAAVTLLPAGLGFAGRHLDRLSIHRRTGRGGETRWHRWSRFVQRHPAACAATGLVMLGALVVPTFSMRLASADAGNDPAASTTRRAYDLLADGFGPGSNGPLLVVAESGDEAALDRLSAAIGADLGVAAVADIATNPAGTMSVVTVIPTTGPQDAATADLVHRLRDDVIPSADVVAHVGGQTAGDVDFAQLMSDRLPVFIGAVLLLSFILLMVVFRSLLVPLKAVVLNLLSIGAAYGVMVAVFQWGWLGGLIGVEEGAPIEPWAPMMLFAIVFGLSMDYEVFLLSSVKERVDRGGSNSDAVVEGLASTARVITAAAAIMVCVFGTFVLGDLRAIKLIGLGLAMAVLLDATVVRLLLVPATMELLGERNWWLPRRLGKVLPTVAVEASR
ncbi:MAG: MMPL family transporter [Actinobacteria bacterium]|nr:MMPL family transporter [Actinomycetota bacterium]